MKKKHWPMILFLAAALLAIGFGVRLYFDYTRYYEFGSAPFYLYFLERLIAYLIPAAACLIAGFVIRRRGKSSKDRR